MTTPDPIPHPSSSRASSVDDRLRRDAAQFADGVGGAPSQRASSRLAEALHDLPERDPFAPTPAWRRAMPWAVAAGLLLSGWLVVSLAWESGSARPQGQVDAVKGRAGALGQAVRALPEPLRPAVMLEKELIAVTRDAWRVVDNLRTRLPGPIERWFPVPGAKDAADGR